MNNLDKLASTDAMAYNFVSGNELDVGENIQPNACRWPAPIEPAAFYGLAGDIVRHLEPHTESDPVALLLQFIAVFGNLIGRTAYFPVEATKHYLNLFIVLVGVSSKGRKGTAWHQVLSFFADIDEVWKTEHLKSGLSSGEGLIWAVRDPIKKTQPDNENPGESKTVIVDPGIFDKRLCDVETEFAAVLKNFQRDGNKLSAVLRDAWDGATLSSLTKGEPAKATAPHITIIGHITKPELLRYLNQTETANGFANRFLWLAVKRSKLLPFGGTPSDSERQALLLRLRQAVAFANSVGAMAFDSEAKADWIQLYEDLSHEKPGLLGAMLARGEPQILRLAAVYALLDNQRQVLRHHLEAAMAIWQYCENSCRYIFGNSTGNVSADKIIEALSIAPKGLTQTELQGVFNNNLPASKFRSALGILQESGIAHVQQESSNNGGRNTSRWRLRQPNESTKYEINEKTVPQ